MIIVEGPDGAGKSTLVDQLTEDFGLEIGQRATDDRSKLYTVTRQDTYTALGEAVKGDAPPKIWDRLFFSEMVYAPVVGRDCEFSADERLFVNAVLNAMECPIILCLPPWETVKKNVAGSEQMDGVHENLQMIYSTYAAMFNRRQGILWYDYTGERRESTDRSYLELKRIINYYLERREERRWTPVQ